MLIEKAYAKLHGSYKSLENGYNTWALVDLTGCPFNTLRYGSGADLDANWQAVVEADERGNIMTCIEASADTRGDSLAEDYYTIMEVKEMKSNGKNIRLLHIRNPFDAFDWDGDWGYDSDLWERHP